MFGQTLLFLLLVMCVVCSHISLETQFYTFWSSFPPALRVHFCCRQCSWKIGCEWNCRFTKSGKIWLKRKTPEVLFAFKLLCMCFHNWFLHCEDLLSIINCSIGWSGRRSDYQATGQLSLTDWICTVCYSDLRWRTWTKDVGGGSHW